VSTALDLDPYLLPSPTPDSLVIRPDLAGTLRTGYDTRYTDMIWPLGPLTDNPSAHSLSIHWDCCPAVLRNELRLVTWNMINGQLRPAFLADRGPRMRGRVSSYYLAETIRQWMGLARWLDDRGVSTLAACDASVLHAYGLHLRAKHSRNQMKKTLLALTRLWAFDQLGVHPVRIGRPPWEDQGIDDYLPAATEVGGENATEPLAEQTMGPLLIWAMRMVDEFADDILAGWAERQRLVELASTTSGTPAGRAALHAYLGPLVEAGAQLPTTTIRNEAGLARFYIAGVTGSSLSQVDGFRNSLIRRGWRLSTLSVTATLQPATCPLNVPVNGRIAGRLWRKAMDFNEVLPLMRYLGTAAFVVCAYLTGMRTGEKRAELR
jgi:hypothetical protein